MKKLFTLLTAILLLGAASLQAQINEESPYPVSFFVTSPESIAGEYDYGTQATDGTEPIWGPELSEDLSGELVWAYSENDSLGCEPIVTDLTGKFALIRRGVCDFSLKVYHAQQAGAVAAVIVNHYNDDTNTGATIVNMLGGDSLAAVTIPAVFINRATGELIVGELDAGNTVEVEFNVNTFYDAVSSYSYHTPLAEAIPIDVFQINFLNVSSTDEAEVTVTATISSPSGAEEALTGTSMVGPLGDSVVVIDGSYMPTELGEHTVTWTNSVNSDMTQTNFVMTENTWAVDNGTLSLAPATTDQDFIDGGLTYQAGSLVATDDDGAVVTHISFGLANAAALSVGDPVADQVVVLLYDGDANDDNQTDFAASGASFNDLVPVALGSYSFDANLPSDQMVFVALEDLNDGDNLVELDPNSVYYATVVYDGTEAGIGVCPQFLASTDVAYLGFPTTPIFIAGDLFGGGWIGADVAVRLHTEGFVGTDDQPRLEVGQMTVSPNPATDVLNIDLDLKERAEKVDITLLDVYGRVIQRLEWNDVLSGQYPMDVTQLSAGTYILLVSTPEGYRAAKFIKH